MSDAFSDIFFAVLAGLAAGPIGVWLGCKFLDWRERRAERP